MKLEEHLNGLVQRLSSAAGQNLVSVVLHGSAAADDFQPEFSDVNVLCVVGELSVPVMQSLAPVLGWWTGLGHPAPLFFTASELQAVADVFPIEMFDIKHRHRILHGTDPFQDLEVPMALHRVQLEHEIRTKLLLLRQHYLSISPADAARLRHLMLDSVSNFLALFRHTLIAMGEVPPHHKSEVAQRIAAKLGFDPHPLQQLLDVRQQKLKSETLDANKVFAGYLRAIEAVVEAVDKL
jgi:hypothetical protein